MTNRPLPPTPPPAPNQSNPKPKTLKDLLQEVNPDTELTQEDKEWLNMAPIGQEII